MNAQETPTVVGMLRALKPQPTRRIPKAKSGTPRPRSSREDSPSELPANYGCETEEDRLGKKRDDEEGCHPLPRAAA